MHACRVNTSFLLKGVSFSMGLIKAIAGAAGGVMADQWKEFFYCDALDERTLMVKGKKRISSRSSNTHGNDNIISNGSLIAVSEGQAMIIVEQGKVVEFCAVPGEFTYDTSTEPSIFAGSLGDSILRTFKLIGKRFTFGGDTAKDQRVYYFNTKELTDNKFGTPSPVPFRVVDRNINLDIDVSLRCNGVFSYKIANPLLFYTNVCGNVTDEYKRDKLDSQLKAEFINSLQPALAQISTMQVRPNEIPAHVKEICAAMNDCLSKDWNELRGLQVVSVAFNAINLPEEDMELIKTAQRNAINRDPTMAAATLVGSQAEAMTKAAQNQGGAMTGFMGMGMAQNAGGMNAQTLFQLGQQQQQQQAQYQAQQAQASKSANPDGGWTCECGQQNQGKFCMNCGKPRPEAPSRWFCPDCGTPNEGKFCMNCGKQKP